MKRFLLLFGVTLCLVGCSDKKEDFQESSTTDTSLTDDSNTKGKLAKLIEGEDQDNIEDEDQKDSNATDLSSYDEDKSQKLHLSDLTEGDDLSKQEVDLEAYQSIISEYEQILSTGMPIDNMSANFLSTSIQSYATIQYAYADVTHNGVPELLIATDSTPELSLLDLYTIIDGQVVKLTTAHDLTMLGERMTLEPLTDGRFLFRGSSSAWDHLHKLFRYDASQQALVEERSGVEETDLGGLAPRVDLLQYEWHPFND